MAKQVLGLLHVIYIADAHFFGHLVGRDIAFRRASGKSLPSLRFYSSD